MPSKLKTQISGQQWFIWHSWIGLVGGLVLFIICWGGSFATLSHEIDWLLNSDIRVSPLGETKSFEAIHQAVSEAYPNSKIQNIYTSRYPNFAADVLIRTEHNQTRHVYVDPYTLNIKGSTSFFNVQRYLRDFHRRLFIGDIGFYLVCIFSIPLIASLITGLYFYKRWWQRFFVFDLGKTLRAKVSNLHKLLGLWVLWFMVIIAITGAWYMVERMRSQFFDGIFAFADSFENTVQPLPKIAPTSSTRLPFSELMSLVRKERPNLEFAYVSLDRNGYFYAVGKEQGFLVRNRANKIFINPYSGEVAYSQRAYDLSPYWYWSNMADPLHFGNFAGLVSKLIWFAAGLSLSFLCISGAWLFAKRLARSSRLLIKGRYALVFAGAGGILISFTPLLPAFNLDKFGPVINGVAQSAQIAMPAVIAIFCWILLTWAIAFGWLWMFIRPKPKQL